ncbi:MAG: tyrosine-type recombinase/integrase [Candidatus Nanopelagicales bacterium]
MLLGEYLERWLDQGAPSWSPNTLRQRRSAVRAWIAPGLGSVPLAELGTSKVREWQSSIASQTTPGNVNNVVAVLSAALGAAVSDGMIPLNPCHAVRRVRNGAPRRRRIDYRTAQRILPYLSGANRTRAALLLMAGLRPAEASALMWSDVHDDYLVIERTIQGGSIQPTKTGAVRTVPIQDDLRVELWIAPRVAKWVAPAPGGGAMNGHNYSRRVLAPAGRASGVRVTQYDFRHACATHMLIDLGIAPVLVASYLGHSPAVLLDIYSGAISPSHVRSVR